MPKGKVRKVSKKRVSTKRGRRISTKRGRRVSIKKSKRVTSKRSKIMKKTKKSKKKRVPSMRNIKRRRVMKGGLEPLEQNTILSIIENDTYNTIENKFSLSSDSSHKDYEYLGFYIEGNNFISQLTDPNRSFQITDFDGIFRHLIDFYKNNSKKSNTTNLEDFFTYLKGNKDTKIGLANLILKQKQLLETTNALYHKNNTIRYFLDIFNENDTQVLADRAQYFKDKFKLFFENNRQAYTTDNICFIHNNINNIFNFILGEKGKDITYYSHNSDLYNSPLLPTEQKKKNMAELITNIIIGVTNQSFVEQDIPVLPTYFKKCDEITEPDGIFICSTENRNHFNIKVDGREITLKDSGYCLLNALAYYYYHHLINKINTPVVVPP